MTSRWLTLLLMTRLLAAGVAVLLLVVHRVTAHDSTLVVVTIAFTAVTLAALAWVPRLQRSPVVWLVDGVGVLALVAASEDWRSPFYILMLTALILPSTALPFRRALAWGVAFTLGYLGVAVYTELDANTLESTIRLETITTHLMVPLVVVLALAYATDVLERLRGERVRSEQLAVESERQRIAWELHDSAKQRVHAAHLVLSALHGQLAGPQAELVGHALASFGQPVPTWTRASPSCACRSKAVRWSACSTSARPSSRRRARPRSPSAARSVSCPHTSPRTRTGSARRR